MTAHVPVHRAPSGLAAKDRRRTRTAGTTAEPVDRVPEVELAVAAVLVVLAGPVAQLLAPGNGLVAALSLLLLGTGLLLALAAARHLLHQRG